MKKLPLKALCLAFALLIVSAAAAGCGNAAEKADDNRPSPLAGFAGEYRGVYKKFVGDAVKVTDEPFTLLLKEDGSGTFTRDGYNFDVTWSIDGDKISVTETFVGISIEYNGTLKDGVLDIFNGEPEDPLTCEYVLNR
ncbi:MAG: hypothetical protein IJM18_06190 [Clostridia bacterium]|nr:hypothetical protein [Clostridia bacterium]